MVKGVSAHALKAEIILKKNYYKNSDDKTDAISPKDTED